MSRNFSYRPDVDGLRAVAVAIVVLFHAKLGMPGGFVGVDVFFVISGYLITGLILKEQARGEFRLAEFFGRRIRRIAPAVTVMVAATLVAGWFLLLPGDCADLGRSAIAQQCMVANVYFWRNTDYFAGPADFKPLLHTWSLAVEEQFYLVYPLLLMALARLTDRRRALILAVLAAASFAASEWGARNCPSATFYLLPTRAGELLLGGLVCLAPRIQAWRAVFSECLALAGLGGIMAAAVTYTPTMRFPGVAALLPCCATAALIHANASGLTRAGRLLASRPLVAVGLASYSLYLWHWPLLAFARYTLGEELPMDVTMVIVVASGAAAWASWRWVETPFRTRALLGTSRALVSAFAVTAGLMIAAGTWVQQDGLRSRFPPRVLDVIDQADAGKEKLPFEVVGNDEQGWKLPVIGAVDDASRRPCFILWGDSHARRVAPTLDRLARQRGLAGYFAGLGGIPPMPGGWGKYDGRPEWRTWYEHCLGLAERERLTVFLVAAWDSYVHGRAGLPAAVSRAEAPTMFARDFPGITRRIDDAGLEAFVVLQPPFQHGAVPFTVAKRLMHDPGATVHGVDRDTHRRFQAVSRDCFESCGPGVTMLDGDDRFFDETGRSVVAIDGRALYADSNHLTPEGVERFLEPLLASVLDDLARQPSQESTDKADP